MNDKIEETTQYESCVDQKETSGTLAKFIQTSDGKSLEFVPSHEEWKKHWKDMPEFKNDEKKPFKTINVHFRTEEDYYEFAKMIDQNLTDKTKAIWHPKLEKNNLLSRRWIE
jgi:hypothetical protein